jgi:hypothetical protein
MQHTILDASQQITTSCCCCCRCVLQWPGATHFPDFLSKGRTWPWWQRQLARMHSQVKFDGLWIDMNEVGLSLHYITLRCIALRHNGLSMLIGNSKQEPTSAGRGPFSYCGWWSRQGCAVPAAYAKVPAVANSRLCVTDWQYRAG